MTSTMSRQAVLLRWAVQASKNPQQFRCMGAVTTGGSPNSALHGNTGHTGLVDIGKREVVGFGANGDETYCESIMFPFPAIRFKEDNAEISMLREKEKGDWKKMTIPEKKTLYRASFAQTVAEMESPTGQWKSILGCSLLFISLGFGVFLWKQKFVYGPMPITITDRDHRVGQALTMLKQQQGRISGFSSTFDYEKLEWKK